jgi:hypothetical protein
VPARWPEQAAASSGMQPAKPAMWAPAATPGKTDKPPGFLSRMFGRS